MMMMVVVVIISLIMVIIDHEGCISENRTGTSWTRLGLTIKITEFFQLLNLICFCLKQSIRQEINGISPVLANGDIW